MYIILRFAKRKMYYRSNVVNQKNDECLQKKLSNPFE